MQTGRCARLLVEPLGFSPNAESVVEFFACADRPAILESLQSGLPFSNLSVFASDPVEEIALVNDFGHECIISTLENLMRAKCPISIQERAYFNRKHAFGLQTCPDSLMDDEWVRVPFLGGWIGYIAYEAGMIPPGHSSCVRSVDPSRPNLEPTRLEATRLGRSERFHQGDVRNALPVARFCLYDTALLHWVGSGEWILVAVEWSQGYFEHRFAASGRIEQLRSRVRAACNPQENCADPLLRQPTSPPSLMGFGNRAIDPFGTKTAAIPLRSETESNLWRDAHALGFLSDVAVETAWSKSEYFACVAQAKRYIESGDVFEVNLAQRFEAASCGEAHQLYQALRVANPASFAAYLSWKNAAVISSSPELFLDVRDSLVTTRPIKGTAPRSPNPEHDAVNRKRLETSAKDRAELVMIIDLLRNDLGRVCEAGSIEVVEAARIEAHPTVFHQTATIQGRLKQEHSVFDLLRSAFPGGSITGAPKIRAMQIIQEIEPHSRGVYCGAIGWLGLDNTTQWSVAIRTMTQAMGRLVFHAGGAITSDSDPEEEWAEILAKAEGMMQAIRLVAAAQRATEQTVL